MERTVLIMAGGQGERFWPSSRRKMPKQFLCLTDEQRTMIQLTVDRVRGFTDLKHIYVVTNGDYLPIVKQQIPDLPGENILCEPVGRNTAPCIALGAAHIAHKYGDALMVVMPSDHLVKITPLFHDVLEEACSFAETGNHLVTIGIPPSSPETGYGYIQFRQERVRGRVYPVNGFVEKPDLETAKKYVASNEFLWNSGIFIWKSSSILESMNRYLPEMTEGIERIRNSIGKEEYERELSAVFSGFPKLSVDYGILEKADNVFTLAGNFGWDDVGSWLAASRIRPVDSQGNSLQGNVIVTDTRETIIRGEKKLIAAVGLRDMIIVDTEDALLICDKDHAGEIRKVLEILKEKGMEEYL